MKQPKLIVFLFHFRSISFVLVTTALAYLMLAIVYWIVDCKKWWNGAPFLYAGKSLQKYLKTNRIWPGLTEFGPLLWQAKLT